MTLRRQLIGLILLTLALPWAGCQYARELEITLRDNQISNLMEIARSASQQLRAQMATATQGDIALHASELQAPAILDGYADEWQEIDKQLFRGADTQALETAVSIALRAGVFHRHLYVFFEIPDTTKYYFNPTRQEANGDRLYLNLWQPQGEATTLQLTTSAPGVINVKGDARLSAGIEGSWQETEKGYAVELTIPTDIVAYEIQFVYADALSDQTEQKTPFAKGKVIIPDTTLKNTLAVYAQPNRRLYVTNGNAWVLAETGEQLPNDIAMMDFPNTGYGSVGPVQTDELSLQKAVDGILTQIYRLILSENSTGSGDRVVPHQGRFTQPFIESVLRGEPAGNWRQHRLSEADIVVGYPIYDHLNPAKTVGAVVLAQRSEAILSVENQAISRLFRLSFSAIALITAALVLFTGVLSSRINRLSQAAKQVLSADGQFSEKISESSMQDEIGDLNRSLVILQSRLREYTLYLKTLAAKLSHELRTPLAIVRSSLENLEDSGGVDAGASVYLTRANEGLDRLRYIVTAMSAATRVEQSIVSADTTDIVLNDNLRNLVDSYQQSAPEHKVSARLVAEPLSILGNDELIAQMLDKLFENALEFTPPGDSIEFSLEKDQEHAVITVSNEGPLLPEAMQQHLFDSLVSVRAEPQAKAHLGLGLHIVKLIVEFHGGQVFAENREDSSGVCFTVRLPCR